MKSFLRQVFNRFDWLIKKSLNRGNPLFLQPHLCGLVVEAGDLEQRLRAPAPVKSVTPKKDDVLYTKERIIFEFDASDKVIWTVLNQCAVDPLFIIVRRIQMHNEKRPNLSAFISKKPSLSQRDMGLKTSYSSWEKFGVNRNNIPSGEQPALSHEERIVAGRENVGVRLELDVYRFAYEEEDAS
ncbi:MAG: hypothetical protein GKR87_15025 [Kiritimatiellae bacterium]|nr:hypothetical protein [Kiritimatiellia bacterium]